MDPIKLLITGFHRSGTTLVADIIRRQPEIRHLFHESTLLHHSRKTLFASPELQDHQLIQTTGTLYRGRNVERIPKRIDFSLEFDAWGNKMSFPGPSLLQDWNGTSLSYIQRWYEYFGSESRVVCLVRHPWDVFASCARRWQEDAPHIRNYGPQVPDIVFRDWAGFYLDLIAGEKLFSNWLYLRFEDLVSDPETYLTRIFLHLGFDGVAQRVKDLMGQSMIFFGKFEQSRAFDFQKNPPTQTFGRVLTVYMRPILQKFGYEL